MGKVDTEIRSVILLPKSWPLTSEELEGGQGVLNIDHGHPQSVVHEPLVMPRSHIIVEERTERRT